MNSTACSSRELGSFRPWRAALGPPRSGRLLFSVVVGLCLACPLLVADQPAGDVEGITEPFATIDLAAADPDILAAVHVKEGELVRRGQLLAELDLTILNSALKIAQARAQMHGEVDAAVAEFEFKRERFLKLQELGEVGGARTTELQRARLDVVVAEAALVVAREAQTIAALEVERIEAQIERRRIRSPLDGSVTVIHKDAAEIVLATDPKVLTVVQLDPLRATFAVPASWAAALREGQPVRLRLADSRERAQGVVEFVSQVNDAESGTVRVKILLANGDGRYRSGVRCFLELGAGDPRRASN